MYVHICSACINGRHSDCEGRTTTPKGTFGGCTCTCNSNLLPEEKTFQEYKSILENNVDNFSDNDTKNAFMAGLITDVGLYQN